MSKPRVAIDLAAASNLAAQVAAWKSGGVFAPGQTLEAMAECDVALTAHSESLVLPGRVIMVTPGGIGIEFVPYDANTKAALKTFGDVILAAVAAPSEPIVSTTVATVDAASDADADANANDAVDDADARRGPASAHERLRNLPIAEQIKLALKGELAERIMLERIYGKTVWEALLRNPRITPPEVARISRMGTLPRPMLETICSNGTWLQVPEVRRALLSNPRLGVDQIPRILRLMPKHELKLVPTQTAYAMAVRDHARRMLKDA
ncbi:MAG TPA: hypothetical protein PLF40_29700 [Kofleriaceae bacterium]|nr:hypothetical protein [Kofleriaceae bacterium]